MDTGRSTVLIRGGGSTAACSLCSTRGQRRYIGGTRLVGRLTAADLFNRGERTVTEGGDEEEAQETAQAHYNDSRR
ncbi:hypothetical protein AB0H51_27475 [Streptomyces griseoluteus]|uniref:hypothetical protein n=1 Tax=Streptomyces griseoluteus TaxID=29306 RepID=UPI00340D4F0F